MRSPAEMPRRPILASRRLRIGLLVALAVVIVLGFSLQGLARFYTDYLWFDSVHFTSVFRGVLLTKIALGAAFIAIFLVLAAASLTVADRVAPRTLGPGPDDELVVRYRQVSARRGRPIRLVTAAIFAVFAGAGANAQWNDWDLFRYGGSFHAVDPQWHRDIGFYVFKLPFIEFLLTWAFDAVLVVLILTLVAHYLNGGIRFQAPAGQRTTAAVKTHLSVLLAAMAAVKAVDYYFQRLELVLSTNHVVHGATATSVHANAPADRLLMVIAALAGVLFLVNVRQRGWTLPVVGVGLWLLMLVVLGGVYPALYQSLRVSPSELTRERPYIARNIAATRTALGLDAVTTQANYPGNAELTPGTIDASPALQQTIANIRLLDPTQLSQTFDKLQSVRAYYTFNSLDVDRYTIDGNLTQVITSARELLESGVQPGFVNQRLEYTHGYGAAVTPAGQSGVNANGTPAFTLAGVPPTGANGGPPQPPLTASSGAGVYFGTSNTPDWVVAATKQPELDYQDPTTEQTVSTSYAGGGGVDAGSLLRRAAFALRFSDANLVLSGQITAKSKVIFYRNITERVAKAAPFLKLDQDPYSVVLGKQVWWVQDAYTTSADYPYAQQVSTDRINGGGLASNFNYVRNSVKVAVNATTGQMHLFVMAPGDPIIETYQRAFPDLFTPVGDAERTIPGITAHWRYPTDLLRAQTNMYGRYHLTNPADFYTQANGWVISQDPGSGQLQATSTGAAVITATSASAAGGIVAPSGVSRLDPEYLIADPPASRGNSVQFMALQPFVAQSQGDKQQNLTAIVTATMDPDGATHLQAYETTPGVTVDGPALISNAIRSNNEISYELSLFNTNQGGSTALLGRVETVPIDSTLLYVEPIYIESSSNAVPTLHDVVVVYNNQAFHSGNASLDAALCNVTNADQSHPFAMYCNTQAAKEPSQTVPTGPGGPGASSSTTSTTAPPATSAVPPPPAGASATQLLQQAQQAFAAAQAALKAGNLASYQADIAQAQQLVDQAASAVSPSTTPAATTTSPPTTAGRS